jgi:hypothetical protein
MKNPKKLKFRPGRRVPISTLRLSPDFGVSNDRILSLIMPLNKVGAAMAIAVDSNNVVVAGGDVLFVSRLLGEKFIRVVRADRLSADDVRTLRLSTNSRVLCNPDNHKYFRDLELDDYKLADWVCQSNSNAPYRQ